MKSPISRLSLLGLALVLSSQAVFAAEADWAAAINKAKFAELKGNFDDAESQLQDSLDRAKTVPDKRAKMFSNLELGNLYADWNKPQKAENFYNQAADDAKKDSPFTEAFVLHQAADHSAKAGRAELATEYQARYDKISRTSGALPNLDLYMNGFRQKVRTTWIPSTRTSENVAKVIFVMSKDGKPQLLHLQHSSGDDDEDARALNAVANVPAFDPLPAGSPRSGIAMEESFDYKPAPQFSKAPSLQPAGRRRLPLLRRVQ